MVEIRRVSEDEFGVRDSSSVAAELRRVGEACDAYDDVITLNEQACLQLKYRGLRDATLWVARERGDGPIVGFALLHQGIVDLAVHPDHRGQGIGTELATQIAAVGERIEAWSHANHPAAARIADRFGVPHLRDLVIMSRPTAEPVVEPEAPAGVIVRTFRPEDEAALLEVNATAFATHPEQGHMTHEDFVERTREGWFEAEGLFVAIDADGTLLGFHWTKVHRDETPPYGEVYVVAVSPRAAGRGLGTLLTSVGLRHLATTGVEEVILYVDGDNAPALAVYRGQGFTRKRTEVQYRGVPTS